MRKKRNTPAFTFLAWASFTLALGFNLVGIYNAEWSLVEKGFYAACIIWAVTMAFVLAKVVRDNEEDKEEFDYTHKEKELSKQAADVESECKQCVSS